MRLLLILILALTSLSCDGGKSNVKSNAVTPIKPTALPVYTYDIVNTYKHDSRAFTQGLVFLNGVLYESTGREGQSTLRKVELETGKVLQKYDLPHDIFAEGISILGDKIYQISWKNSTAWSYNLEDFKLLKEYSYPGDGWGLTNDGKFLIMTDGTHVIRFIDPENFQTDHTVPVFQEDGKPLYQINELEYVKGEIWGNVWHSENIGKPNHIARIDPKTGKLLGWIDLGGISPDDVNAGDENTLNGIAYDAAADRIFVTGKNWKKLFEIKLKPKV